MAATDCTDSTVLPVIFNGTCSGTGNNLRQVSLPEDVANLNVELLFPVVTDGYAMYVGADEAAAGTPTDPSPCVAKTWYLQPRITNPALFFVASNTSSAAFKIRLTRRLSGG